MTTQYTATHVEFDLKGKIAAIGTKNLTGGWKHSRREVISNMRSGSCTYNLQGARSRTSSPLIIDAFQNFNTRQEANKPANLIPFQGQYYENSAKRQFA